MVTLPEKIKVIKKLKKFIYKNDLDGYIIPKNDKYFTEYSKVNNLSRISKFTGSAGFAIVLKKSNYLFVDGRYTLQANKQSGDNFQILELPHILPKNLNKLTNIKNINSDGFEYIKKKLDKEKSYFILIDPSYEIKEDFIKIENILDNLERYEKSKIVIWYPILNFNENDIFIENIRKKGISNIINVELPIKSNDENKGMKGSGLLIINFNKNKILNDFKGLLKELHFYLKQDDDVFNPKVRLL